MFHPCHESLNGCHGLISPLEKAGLNQGYEVESAETSRRLEI